MPNCSPLWFLPATFVASIIFLFIRKYKGIKYIAIVFLCGIVGYLYDILDILWLPWQVWPAIMAIPFIALGNGMRIYEKVVTGWIKNYGMIMLCFICGMIMINFNIEVSFGAVEYGNLFCFYVGSIGVSLGIIGISKRIGNNFLLEKIGRNTIMIIGFNYLFNDIIEGIWKKNGITNYFFYQYKYSWLYRGMVLVIVEVIIFYVLIVIKEKRRLLKQRTLKNGKKKENN